MRHFRNAVARKRHVGEGHATCIGVIFGIPSWHSCRSGRKPKFRGHSWPVLEKETETCSVCGSQGIVNITTGDKYQVCTIENVPINKISLYSSTCRIARKAGCWENYLRTDNWTHRAASIDIFGNMLSWNPLVIVFQRGNIGAQVRED